VGAISDGFEPSGLSGVSMNVGNRRDDILLCTIIDQARVSAKRVTRSAGPTTKDTHINVEYDAPNERPFKVGKGCDWRHVGT
jgi:hypothetical protein